MIITRPGVFPVTLKLKDMRAKTTISDFRFEFAGYGHYKVTYTSPVTGKQWTAKTNDMPLIEYYNDMNDDQKAKFREEAFIPDDVGLELEHFEELYEKRKDLLA